MSIVVFWLESGEPRAQGYADEAMSQALAHCEALRQRTRAGEPVGHVCISAELDASVGQAGVSDRLPEGYDWKKRRGDPKR